MKLLNCLTAIILLLASSLARADHEDAISPAELDALLAPVALYPDTVLSQLLLASTHPLDIVQAARWSRAHPALHGQAAVSAVERRDWHPSVKALVAFPDLLARLDEDLEWTQRLGEAFLIAEEEVSDSIQRLRRRAHAAGHLHSGEHWQVLHHSDAILIEPPLYSHVVYLPFYDTRVVYGHWWWPLGGPHWWACPRGHYPRSGFFWSTAVRVSAVYHSSSFHWPRRQVVVLDHPYRPHHRPRHWGHHLASHEHARHWRHRHEGRHVRPSHRPAQPPHHRPSHGTGQVRHPRQDSPPWLRVVRPDSTHEAHQGDQRGGAGWQRPAHAERPASERPRHAPSQARPQPKPALRADPDRHEDRTERRRPERHQAAGSGRRGADRGDRRSNRDYR